MDNQDRRTASISAMSLRDAVTSPVAVLSLTRSGLYWVSVFELSRRFRWEAAFDSGADARLRR